VYAVLYAPTYRERYAEFLRIDFPRIPFTANVEVFREMARLGERLATLHLLTSTELDPPAAKFEGDGDNRVAKTGKKGLRYEPSIGRVYINGAQYFAPVPSEVWEYRVGGYQVCEKWLKDRKGRRLELEDIRTYCRIVTSLGLTIGIQEEIESVYPGVEERLITF
jgi:predicted helicase